MKNRHRVVIAVFLGVLGLIPLVAPALAQNDPAAASTDDQWSTAFRERHADVNITIDELRWLNHFRNKYPEFADEDLLTILRWRRTHPGFDDEDLDIIVGWHDKYPGFSEDDMTKFWKLHKLYPDFDQDELGRLNTFHNENPWFGMKELGQAYEFHRTHPWIEAKHLPDMLRYWHEHRKAAVPPLEQAYTDYKKDPEAFRRKHKIKSQPAHAQPPARRKSPASTEPDGG